MSYVKRPSLTFPQNSSGHVLEAHDTGVLGHVLEAHDTGVLGHVLEAHDTGVLGYVLEAHDTGGGAMCWKHMPGEMSWPTPFPLLHTGKLITSTILNKA